MIKSLKLTLKPVKRLDKPVTLTEEVIVLRCTYAGFCLGCMTYLNITAYHFCLRFFIYSTCTTLHTQLILLRKHATKRQTFEEIKRKGKRPPFPPFMPSFLHFPIMLTKPSCFCAQNQILVAYPQDTSIIDMVKREIDMEKAAPFFLTFPLYLKHCPQCPAKPPCFGPQTGIYKENHPLFPQFGQKKDWYGKKPPHPFSSLSLFILSTAHHVQPNPHVLAHNRHLQGFFYDYDLSRIILPSWVGRVGKKFFLKQIITFRSVLR